MIRKKMIKNTIETTMSPRHITFPAPRWTCILLLLQLLQTATSQLSVSCAPNEEHCFAVHIPKDRPHSISGNYNMMDQEHLSSHPVAVILFDQEDNALWHSKPGQASGEFSLLDVSGRFHLCFGNGSGGYFTPGDLNRKQERESRRTTLHKHNPHMKFHIDDDHYDYTNHDGQGRTFTFHIRVEPSLAPDVAHSIQGGPNPERVILNSILQLKNKMNNHLDHWIYMNTNEATHRALSENTFSSVVWLAVVQFLILIVASTTQVWYVKKFFEVKRYL